MQTITIAASVDTVLDGELQRLASATGRTVCEVITDALVSYVAAERQFMTDIDMWEPDGAVMARDAATEIGQAHRGR